MKRLAALCLMLAACDGDKTTPAEQSGWEIGPVIDGTNYSKGTYIERQGEGFAIELPRQDGVHYVTRPGSLAGKTRIVMRYRIELAEGAKIVPSSDPAAPSIGPTLYFQKAGDDWATDGNRWWATFASPSPMVAGEFEIIAPIDGAWTSVMTITAKNSPDEFLAAWNSADRIGFTLGGGTGYGHGVYATGQARLTVLSFREE